MGEVVLLGSDLHQMVMQQTAMVLTGLEEVKNMIRHGIVVEAGGERAVVQLTRHAA